MTQQTYEQPPTVAERADDARYANEFATIVAGFRIALESWNGVALTARCCELANGKFALAHEQPVLYFLDRWGFPAVLRALATAIADPINPTAPLVGD